jgi:tetratricopeptide (TPR) repeat protein
MTAYYFLTGDLDRAISASQRALTIGTELDDVVLQAAACGVIGQAYIRQGDHPKSVAYQRQGLRLLGHSAKGMFLGSSALLTPAALSYLAWSLGELGQFDEAIERGEAALQAAQASGHAFSQVAGAFTLGRVCLTRGDVERATVVLERGLEVCQAANFRTVAYFGVAGFLGEAYMLAGRIEESLALLEDVAERTLQLGIISDYFSGAIALIEAYRLAGRPEAALQTATQTIDLATKHAERACLALALHALARLYAGGDPPDADEAERRFRDARALADELGMRPLQAHCHLGLGELYRRTGRLEEARAALTTAVAMLREMGMTLWLPEAEAELTQAGGSQPVEFPFGQPSPAARSGEGPAMEQRRA